MFDDFLLVLSTVDQALGVVLTLLFIVQLGLYVTNQYLDFKKRMGDIED